VLCCVVSVLCECVCVCGGVGGGGGGGKSLSDTLIYMVHSNALTWPVSALKSYPFVYCILFVFLNFTLDFIRLT
jgi:hypothetical protein